ncbi:hypothetical protein LEP1GSC072_2663 [Leptospira noguchii str. Bonito]|nr:hypothetical protein LEP1GSC072_2663 [Leptospira noguchii str. Bonito]
MPLYNLRFAIVIRSKIHFIKVFLRTCRKTIQCGNYCSLLKISK